MLGKLEDQQRQAALGLLKRLPPQHLEENLDNFAKIAPHLKTSLAPYISRPGKLEFDKEVNRYFIACEYNCDQDSYRSPWTSKYYPEPKAGVKDQLYQPVERLRHLEEVYNEVFNEYKTTYYEGGVSSVYMWDLDEGFAAAFLIRKELLQSRGVEAGTWDITHIVEVREHTNTKYADYRLHTSLYLSLECGNRSVGEVDLGSYFTRTLEERHKKQGDEAHLGYIGKMIEEIEISLRQSLDLIYAAKHREILNHIRTLDEDLLPDGSSVQVEKANAKRRKQRMLRAKSTAILASSQMKASNNPRATSAPPKSA
eukprot:TRINITY_DN73575_c0_g1_i1.p1 TRINITY_DN73575_c0_g1~~TRINITY_DN73575_c0_g1_i1.p1  ORF type:complete len:312 (+),score=70.25 TRINITY_DN73575_c0_g1_i1:147-1082(+)